MTKNIFFLLFSTLVVFWSNHCFAGKSYQDHLIQSALETKLYESPYWHGLLHYQSRLGGFKSEIASDQFFLAADGKFSPAHEMVATLAGFFQEVIDEQPQNHPLCRFPARLQWLIEKLSLDRSLLPQMACPNYAQWLKELNPGSITLVFPEHYARNPVSMFGHLLLRINPKQYSQTPLLSTAINYGAQVDNKTVNPLTYVVKGVFGGFSGVFTIRPYYAVVKNYNDMEARNIWEYDLDFSQKERDRLLNHLWELKRQTFAYYFFKENCSYQLLSLLEAAQPGLNLKEHFWLWTIPSDVVRLVVSEKKLSKQSHLRPSRFTSLQQKWQQLDQTDKQLTHQIIKLQKFSRIDQWESLSNQSKVKLLDLLLDYYSLIKTPDALTKKQAVLTLRAQLKVKSTSVVNVQDQDQQGPETGHPSSQIQISAGEGKKGQTIVRISYRPSYHHFMEQDGGYPDFSTIEVLKLTADTAVGEKPILSDLTFVNLISIRPTSTFFLEPVWKLSSSIRQLDFLACADCLAFDLNAGSGLSYQSPLGIGYGFLELKYNAGYKLKREGQAALGGTMGYFSHPLPKLKLHLRLTHYLSTFQEMIPKVHGLVEASWAIGPQILLKAHWQRSNDQEEMFWGVNLFF